MYRKKVHIKVYGQVQGVFFRAYAKEVAIRLGIVGWVRNNADGSVEAVAQGPKEKLDKFVTWCKKGPPSAKVEKVEVDEQKTEDEFRNFEIV